MQTLVADVLAAWRRAERLADTLAPDTPEHAAAVDACDRLRALYRDLTSAEPRDGADSKAELGEAS